jgi:hypothetical protein
MDMTPFIIILIILFASFDGKPKSITPDKDEYQNNRP